MQPFANTNKPFKVRLARYISFLFFRTDWEGKTFRSKMQCRLLKIERNA